MNPLKKLTITAAAAIPAVAMFAGVASAAIEDHVTNGGFNVNAKGWTPYSNGTIAKHDGFPIGVLTNTAKTSDATTATVGQCMQVLPNLDVNFSGRALIPENQERKGSATFQVSLFADEHCVDFLVGAELPALTAKGVWYEFSYNPVPWPGNVAQSARVTMVVEKNASGHLKRNEPFMAFFDDIKLTQFYLLTEDDDPDEDDCLCAPAEPEAPAEPAEEDDAPAVGEPVGPAEDDDTPAEPEAPEQPVEEPEAEEPAAPAEEPAQPAAEPAAQEDDVPAAQDDTDAPAANDGDGSNEPVPGAPSAGSDEPDGDDSTDEPADAETSDQYELEADQDEDTAELGSGQVETPAAPDTGFSVADTKDLVGADELGIFGGVLAFFGLLLAAVAIKRERSNS